MRLNDLTGKRFGNLVVLCRDNNPQHKRPYWKCLCDCGRETIVRGCSLVNGTTKSCGCLKNRCIHGDSVGNHRARLQSIYHTMISRCYNANVPSYRLYGGRGIKVCDDWLNSYSSFKNWAINHGYDDTLSIDRVDVNSNYCPENCRWATKEEQANNRQYNLLITHNGRTQTAAQWARELGMAYTTIVKRYHDGLSPLAILGGELT